MDIVNRDMGSMVFIFPDKEVEFTETLEPQKISIFNPYDFAINYHFQCTQPQAFRLSASEGEVPAKHSHDILVTLLKRTIVEEKFQVCIYNPLNRTKKLGEKILKVVYLPDRHNEPEVARQRRQLNRRDHFQELTSSSSFSATDSDNAHRQGKDNTGREVSGTGRPNEYLMYAALAIGITILMFPHEDDPQASLSVSVTVKLVAAYVLGIVTVFIIRN